MRACQIPQTATLCLAGAILTGCAVSGSSVTAVPSGAEKPRSADSASWRATSRHMADGSGTSAPILAPAPRGTAIRPDALETPAQIETAAGKTFVGTRAGPVALPVPAAEPIQLTSAVQAAEEPPEDAAPPVPVGAAPAVSANAYEIDLPQVMALINANHPLVAFMQWRVQEAEAQTRRAEMLWLPSLRAGVNFNKHEGRIQDVAGTVIETSRGSLYAGAGAQAVGAGSPSVPGVFASFHLADALYQPEIAAQEQNARHYAATTAEHDAWLQAATAYVDLVRAWQDRAIALDVVAQLEELERITGQYAQTGQGLKSDHERTQTELALRRNEVLRTSEAVQVAAARLAQHIRLDPAIEFLPRESVLQPLSLSVPGQSPQQLVADALASRPEAAESRHLVAQALSRWNRERSAPWLPSVLLGVSYGNLTGGLGGRFTNAGDRVDADVAAFWEIRQLGFGEMAARDEANARIEQARWREVATLDRIAREVVEASAQVDSRRQQIVQTEAAVAAAQRSYDLNRERIRNAQGLPIEALQSIQALGQARREYLRCVADFNTAQLAQQRALGWPVGKPEPAL